MRHKIKLLTLMAAAGMMLFSGGTSWNVSAQAEVETEKDTAVEKESETEDELKESLSYLGTLIDSLQSKGGTYGKAWVDASVVGLIDEDTPTNVKDDFYLAINKEWILDTEKKDAVKEDEMYDNRTLFS